MIDAVPALAQPPLYRRLDWTLSKLDDVARDAEPAARSRLEAVQREIGGILASAAPALTELREWLATYREILFERGLARATLQNREAVLRPLSQQFGAIAVGAIRAYDLAGFVRGYIKRGHLHAARYARSVLVDLFNEAISAGLIDLNPALALRTPQAPVQRQRLTLETWLAARAYAAEHMPAWIPLAMDLALVSGQRRAEVAAGRLDHVRNNYLHVVQAKTGVRLRLSLDIRLDVVGLSLGDVIERCRVAGPGEHLVRHGPARGTTAGDPVHPYTLSRRFAEAMRAVCALPTGTAPTFHEQRSLSARLYRDQGRDAQAILGHKFRATTDVYCDVRGVEWISVQ